MLLRIVVDRATSAVTLRLFGRLDSDGVEELQEAYETCACKVELDLSQVRGVDDVGGAYLRGLIDAGVAVREANPYVEALLRLGARNERRPEPRK